MSQMVKINRKEYKILKGLDDEWKWVARDKNGSLFAYLEKPPKDPYSRDWGLTGDEWFLIKEILFQFIQWEDEDPHNIQELIEEYEDSKEYKDSLVIEYFMDKAKESDETEVKDLEWLKGLINEEGIVMDMNLLGRHDEQYWKNENIKINKGRLFYLIDQLDKREVLSQEWISENVEYAYFDMLDGSGRLSSATAIIKPKKLQNLLVPTLSEMKTVEITEEQVMEWLDNNDFYCHATAETVLANAVDKGELDYYGTKYSVVKKEPETVADVITTFWKSYERLKEVMSMDVKDLGE